MNTFTFIPTWVIQDALTLIISLIFVFFIIKNEEKPINILLEFFCFIFLNAAVYENFATMMGWYGYGKSLVMIFNVPITIPIIEYLVVYSSIRLFGYVKMPLWAKPLVVGFMGALFDFTLDPVAIKQIFQTAEGTIGRWSWYPGANDVCILGEPVYNFSGWILFCGYAATFILLGRIWFEKAKNKKLVGYLYPVLSMLASLLVLISPLSQFLLWLGPFFHKGQSTEWVMLILLSLIALVLIIIYGRKKINPISYKKEYPLLLIFTAIPCMDIIFAFMGKYYSALLLITGATILLNLILFYIWYNTHKHDKLIIKH
jgi:hypothetical protein